VLVRALTPADLPSVRAIVAGLPGSKDRVEHEAVAMGFTTLLVVSGTRYRDIGYPFWTRRYGPPVRVDVDPWGPGFERAVWRQDLGVAKN